MSPRPHAYRFGTLIDANHYDFHRSVGVTRVTVGAFRDFIHTDGTKAGGIALALRGQVLNEDDTIDALFLMTRPQAWFALRKLAKCLLRLT